MPYNLSVIALSVVAAGSLTACNSAIDQIDRDTRAAIREHAITTLGQDGNWHEDIVTTAPKDLSVPRAAYDRTPPTVNPAAADLPAKPRVSETSATTQASDLPIYRDPADTGATPAEVDLSQALAYAFAHAPDYRSEKEKLFISAISLLVQRHLWGPRFFNTITAQVAGTPEGGDHEQALSLVNELGATMKLPYGGSVSAKAVVGFVSRLRNISDGSEPDDQQSSQVVLSAVFPLLRGAGIAAQENLIQAQRDLVYGVRTFEKFRRDFLVKVSTSYYELLRAQSEIANRRRQVENLEWLVRRTSALADAGRIANFEVQRSQLRVLFAKSNLVNAQEKYNLALDNFKLTIGRPTRDPVRLKPTEVALVVPDTSPEEAMNAGLTYRVELRTLADQVDDAKRKIDVAKNATLPGLDVKAQTGLSTNPDRRYPGLELDAGSSNYAVGVTMDVPLDRQIEELGVRSAMIDSERAKRNYQLARDRVVLEVRQGMRAIEQARFTLEVQTRNIAIARKRIEGVTLRLRELGPRDFIEAQDDLLDARNLRDTALRDLRVSVLTYLLATGQVRVSPDGQWRAPGKLVAVAGEKGPADDLENALETAGQDAAEKQQENQP